MSWLVIYSNSFAAYVLNEKFKQHPTFFSKRVQPTKLVHVLKYSFIKHEFHISSRCTNKVKLFSPFRTLNSFATKLFEPNSITLFGNSTVTWCTHLMHTAKSGYTLVRESLDLTHLTPLSWVIDKYQGINLTWNCVPQHKVFSSAVEDFLLGTWVRPVLLTEMLS